MGIHAVHVTCDHCTAGDKGDRLPSCVLPLTWHCYEINLEPISETMTPQNYSADYYSKHTSQNNLLHSKLSAFMSAVLMRYSHYGGMLQAGRSRVRFPTRSLGFCKWSNPSNCTKVLGWTQPLIEMSTRKVPGELKGGRRWQLHRHLRVDYLKNVGASTSHNPMGLHGLLQGQVL
jgi:hypothetical protein